MTHAHDGWHYQGDRNYLAYGGYWWRKTGDREATAIRIENLDEDSDKEPEKMRYEIEHLVVDLDDSDMKAALRTVGWFEANPGRKADKASDADRVSAMIAHSGSNLRSGGDDVIRVKGDEAAEKTLDQWKAGVEANLTENLPHSISDGDGDLHLPVPGVPRTWPFKPAANMMMAEPGGKVIEVPQGSVILHDRDKRADKSTKFGALEVQFIDAYRYQRELKIARKYVSGVGLVKGRWTVHAYLHPGLRHQSEISEAVATKLIDRFWYLTTEYRDLLFNPDGYGKHHDMPRGDGFVRFHTALLLGATPSATML